MLNKLDFQGARFTMAGEVPQAQGNDHPYQVPMGTFQAADGLGLSPYPLMMGVGLAASAAFMTPFSHKANLLVMGAGGYRTVDYLRAGTLLTVFLLALIVVLVPIVFPF